MLIRALGREEIDLIWTIDRSEVHERIYKHAHGKLKLVPFSFAVSGWHPSTIDADTPKLYDCFDRGGVFLGCFDANHLVGVSVVDTKRVGTSGDAVQLLYLYVSRSARGRGVGSALFTAAADAARSLGAKSLYVSSVPTEKSVDFYLGRGASIAKDPDPDLFAAEPEDIHLTYRL